MVAVRFQPTMPANEIVTGEGCDVTHNGRVEGGAQMTIGWRSPAQDSDSQTLAFCVVQGLLTS